MNIQLTLAARYLAGRKLRTALTTLAIVFGVLVIFGMNTLIPAFTKAFQATLLAATGQVDATITLKTSDAFPQSIAEQVAAVDGVRASSASLNRTVNLPPDYIDQDPNTPDAITALSLVGLDLENAQTVHAYLITQGRFLEDDDRDATVISQSLADLLNISLGDEISIPSATGERALIIVGILPTRPLPGNEEILVTLAQAQEMLNMPGQINTIEANYDSSEETRRLEIEGAVLQGLGDTFQIGSLATNAELLTNLNLAQAIFNVLGFLALLMGGFIIFNTFRTIIAERRRDIGMLRALGASRSTIMGVVLAEGLVQGIIGTAVGMLLGYAMGLGMVNLLNPVLNQFFNVKALSPVVSPGLVVGSIVLGIGITLMAGLLPALNASKVTPLEALRPTVGVVSIKRMAGPGFWTGAVLIGLAVAALLTQNIGLIGLGGLFFIVGLILLAPALVNPIAILFSKLLALVYARSGTAQLAEGNLSRQPGRAAITASTTLIAMAILVMAASFISSATLGFGTLVRKSLGSDYLLVPPSVALWGSNLGADASLAEDLRQIEGVEVVSSLRFAPTEIKETAVSLIGIDPQTYPKVSGLNFSTGDETQSYAEMMSGRKVILNGILASTVGAKIGDQVELITPTGKQMYEVVAVATDFLNAKITTAYISHANIAEDFGRSEDVFLQIDIAGSADQAALEQEMKTLVKAYPQFRLINGQAYVKESLALFDAAFAGMIALGIFLSVPSLIAMINTLAIGVIERTREIGMLRAVGATRSQVRTVIVSEALILAAIGTGFGVLTGLYLGYMAVGAVQMAGFPMEYIFPGGGILLAIAAGLIFGAIAAIIPARQAARLEIVQALRFE